MKIKGRSKINNKIRSRIFIIGLLTLLVTLVISYITLVPPLRDSAITKAQNVNSQIIQQTDYLLSYIQDYAESIASSVELKSAFSNYFDHPASERYYQLVCLSLNNLSSMRNNIRCIFIETDDGKQFNSISQIDEADIKLLSSKWYKNLQNTDYGGGFSKIYTVNSGGNSIYTAAYSKNFYLCAHRVTVTIFFRANEILYTTRTLAKELDNYVWLDSENVPFYSFGSEDWNRKILQKLEDIYVYKSKSFKGIGGYNFVNSSTKSRWMIVSFVSNSSLVKTFKGYFINIVLLSVLLYLLTSVFLTPTIMNITRPINRLTSVMKEVAGGNLDAVSDVDTNDEIGELSKIFNSMIADLKKHINKLLEKEETEQRMKYSLLISQIDPHFIYNTMNSINYLARKERSQDIIAVNSALIKILQDRLRVNNIEVMDTIEQEIEIVKQYMLIQSYRYENTVELIWDVDQSLNNTQIPKNIIQPLVENALFHGLTDEESGEISGTIKISISGNSESIILKVFDNGRGIETNKLEQLNAGCRVNDKESRGKHIGIASIRERLLYLYGNYECLKIESTPQEGTCVTITLKHSEKQYVSYHN